MNKYQALIGAAGLGFWGGGPAVAFGGDVAYGSPSPGMPLAYPAGGPGFDMALGGYAGCNPYGVAGLDPAMQALISKNSVVMGPDCGPRAKNLPLPLGTGQVIAANTSLTINATPQCFYTPTSLCIPSTIASSLYINDIIIGTNSMFAAVGPIPAMAFIETATYRGLTWDTCLPNQPIQIQFENVTDGDVTLVANFFGVAIPGGWAQIYGQYPK